ncbi:MAG: TetR/AcrR family transcriptional regulator [Oscillospiraceae bacterium]|nr:TetR/AcrR family transcriptional regulator [Oscillospiraceae bacterium]
MSELSGTKELIFDVFVELTSTLGYENVSMRDIAKKVGIQAASIYNHFQTKAHILEYAYDYYTKHLHDNRQPISLVKKLIETEDAQSIVEAINYTFESEDNKKYVRMILITKIVYMRLFQDAIANATFAETIKNNTEYVIDILTHGVNIGRLDPGFDREIFADVLIGAKVVMGIKAFSDSDYVAHQLEKELRILALFTQLLSSALKPKYL